MEEVRGRVVVMYKYYIYIYIEREIEREREKEREIEGGRQREGERERERKRVRQIEGDRQRDREGDREGDRQRDRQREIEREIEGDRERMYAQTGKDRIRKRQGEDIKRNCGGKIFEKGLRFHKSHSKGPNEVNSLFVLKLYKTNYINRKTNKLKKSFFTFN